MKFAWCPKFENASGHNLEQVEKVNLDSINKYTEMLDMDESAAEFYRLEDKFVLLDY